MGTRRSVSRVRHATATACLATVVVVHSLFAEAGKKPASLPALQPAAAIGPVEIGKPFPITDTAVRSLLQSLMKASGQDLAVDGSNLPEYVRLAVDALAIRDRVPDIAAADPLVTVAASFLHDIGGGGPRGEASGPPKARQVLNQVGSSPEFIDRVCAIVGNHHLSAPLDRSGHYPELWIIVGCDVHASVRFECQEELLKIVAARVAAARARAKWQGTPATTRAEGLSHRHRAAWMAEGTYGVMVHYLINPPGASATARTASFNRIVNGFDLDHFIHQIEASRADWLIFTIGQNTSYYCSPNARLDQRLPGHTSTRDLPLEIGRRLAAMGKRLIVYLPAEVAGTRPELQQAFAWNPQDQREFLDRYQGFVRTYSQQYGRYHSGWWFDGCYDHIHQGKWDWACWCDAARAGNADAIVAFNDGAFCVGRVKPVSPLQDYQAGEVHVLEDGRIRFEFLAVPNLQRTPDGRLRLPAKEPKLYLPDGQHVDGVQWHALVPVDSSFAYPTIPNMHYPDEELVRFLRACKAVKGAVTLNVPVDKRGHIPEETAAQLVRIGKAIATRPAA